MSHSGFENADQELNFKSEHLKPLQSKRKNSLLCTNTWQMNIWNTGAFTDSPYFTVKGS